jgi:hypothetical protein
MGRGFDGSSGGGGGEIDGQIKCLCMNQRGED